MKKIRLTMREAIFYQLVINLQTGKNRYIPVHEFMGDIYSPELKLGGFVSHECSARLSEINKVNPDLLEIKKQKAKYSNNHYHCYRINPYFSIRMIEDKQLLNFYNSLSLGEVTLPEEEPTCPHGLPVFVKCPECNIRTVC